MIELDRHLREADKDPSEPALISPPQALMFGKPMGEAESLEILLRALVMAKGGKQTIPTDFILQAREAMERREPLRFTTTGVVGSEMLVVQTRKR